MGARQSIALRSHSAEGVGREFVDAVVGDAIRGRAHHGEAPAGEVEMSSFGEKYDIVRHGERTLLRVTNTGHTLRGGLTNC